jgi:hypothetical protein
LNAGFDNIDLSEYFVLNPYWITFGVYQILTSAYAGTMKGIVDMDKLDFIVNEEADKKETYQPANYKKISYSNNERRFLVDILHQFKLCFYVNNRTQFIIPDLLDTNEQQVITSPIRNAQDSIQFVYDYNYLPKSIMPHIMVDTHNIQTHKWRTGFVLQGHGCTALVANYNNRLTLIVTGEHKQKREFMAVIRHRVDIINKDLTDKPNMLIPLPGTKKFVDYADLLVREKHGEEKYKVFTPTVMEFDICQLLDGIANQDESNKIIHKLDKILFNQEDIKNTLDSHFQYLMALSELGAESNDKFKDELLAAISAMNQQQLETVSNELMDWLAQAFAQVDGSLEKLDKQTQQIYQDMLASSGKDAEDYQLKLKLAVPFSRLTGVSLEAEFDIKSWAKKKYEENQYPLYKLMMLY